MACNQNAGLKERPLIFSGPMVMAILEGRKTQTRRIVKPQPTDAGLVWVKTKEGFAAWVDKYLNLEEGQMRLCPYGQPGDRLWVKETHYLHGHWKKNGKNSSGRQRWKFIALKHPGVRFPEKSKWEDLKPYGQIETSKTASGWFKRPSIFMPRWASRITLEIVNIGVARLQDISKADCIAEGTDYFFSGPIEKHPIQSVRGRFSLIWDCINAASGHTFNSNPWVWVIEFKKVVSKTAEAKS